MGNSKKIVIASLIAFMLFAFFVEAVYMQKSLDKKISDLENRIIEIDTRKRDLANKQLNLATAKEMLAAQMLSEKDALQAKKLEAQIQSLKEKEFEKITTQQSQQLMELQQADTTRIAALQKQLSSLQSTASSPKSSSPSSTSLSQAPAANTPAPVAQTTPAPQPTPKPVSSPPVVTKAS